MSSSLQPHGLQNTRLLCPPLSPRVSYTPLSSLPNGKMSSLWYLLQLSQVTYLLPLFSASHSSNDIYIIRWEVILCLSPLAGNMSHGKRGLCHSSSYSACLTEPVWQALPGTHSFFPSLFLTESQFLKSIHFPRLLWSSGAMWLGLDWKRSVFIPIPKKGNAKKCSKLPNNCIHLTH